MVQGHGSPVVRIEGGVGIVAGAGGADAAARGAVQGHRVTPEPVNDIETPMVGNY